MALIATAALAAAVLFRSPASFTAAVCVIVSMAAIAIAIRCFFIGKLVWALIFLGVLGMFTPFQQTQFSTLHTSVLDMATLALFAASPTILAKSPGAAAENDRSS